MFVAWVVDVWMPGRRRARVGGSREVNIKSEHGDEVEDDGRHDGADGDADGDADADAGYGDGDGDGDGVGDGEGDDDGDGGDAVEGEEVHDGGSVDAVAVNEDGDGDGAGDIDGEDDMEADGEGEYDEDDGPVGHEVVADDDDGGEGGEGYEDDGHAIEHVDGHLVDDHETAADVVADMPRSTAPRAAKRIKAEPKRNIAASAVGRASAAVADSAGPVLASSSTFPFAPIPVTSTLSLVVRPNHGKSGAPEAGGGSSTNVNGGGLPVQLSYTADTFAVPSGSLVSDVPSGVATPMSSQ